MSCLGLGSSPVAGKKDERTLRGLTRSGAGVIPSSGMTPCPVGECGINVGESTFFGFEWLSNQ